MKEIIVTIMLAAIIVTTFAITLLAFIWCKNGVDQQEVNDVEQQEVAANTILVIF